MKQERVQRFVLEALSHVDVKTVDVKGKPEELVIVLKPECQKDLLCGLTSLMSEQLGDLVLTTSDLRSELSLKFDPDAQHNDTFASIGKEARGIYVAMIIRSVSLSNWINRLSYSFCSSKPYGKADKRYRISCGPTLNICTYTWTS